MLSSFQEFFTLHIRALGDWTNKLYDFAKSERNIDNNAKPVNDEPLMAFYKDYVRMESNTYSASNDKRRLSKVPSRIENIVKGIRKRRKTEPTQNDISIEMPKWSLEVIY